MLRSGGFGWLDRPRQLHGDTAPDGTYGRIPVVDGKTGVQLEAAARGQLDADLPSSSSPTVVCDGSHDYHVAAVRSLRDQGLQLPDTARIDNPGGCLTAHRQDAVPSSGLPSSDCSRASRPVLGLCQTVWPGGDFGACQVSPLQLTQQQHRPEKDPTHHEQTSRHWSHRCGGSGGSWRGGPRLLGEQHQEHVQRPPKRRLPSSSSTSWCPRVPMPTPSRLPPTWAPCSRRPFSRGRSPARIRSVRRWPRATCNRAISW